MGRYCRLFREFLPRRSGGARDRPSPVYDGTSSGCCQYGRGHSCGQFWGSVHFLGVLADCADRVAAIFLAGERSSLPGPPISLRRFSWLVSRPSLAAASGIAALAHFVTFGLNIAFIPIFADTLGASKTDLGTVTTVSNLAFALASLVGIVGAQKFGQRSFVIVGSVATTVTVLALPGIHTIPALIALQAINGFARGMVFPVLMGIAISEVPEYERASAMGVFQAVYAIGMFAGPTVAGLVAERLGMHGLFFFVAAFPILGLVVALAWLPSRPVTFRVRTEVDR